MKKAFLIDFYDSFTYNIAASMAEYGIDCEVIRVDKAITFLETLLNTSDPVLLILGPGPGHPSEYKFLFPLLVKTLSKESIFHLGICLGHQIILGLNGGVIRSSKLPMHGRKQKLRIPHWEKWFDHSHWDKLIQVQRYNSLCVEIQHVTNIEYWYDEQNELMGAKGKNFVTYQFHPESVGTTGQKFLFSPVSKFYYNCKDGKSVKAQRAL